MNHGFLENLGEKLQAVHPAYALLLVFVGGLLSSFTPCVYPLIPITLSIFGACGDVTRLKGFSLALAYVLGIAFTYTTLGMVSALSGVVFGSFLGNPWVVTSVAVLLILLGLATLDLWTFSLGQSAQKFAQKIGGETGYRSAFLMGLVSGVVAAPCVGPVLVAILLVAAASPSALWGGTLLFFYSLGLGLPFLVLGTFSGLISRIPKSGSWLGITKFILGTATFAVAAFFISPSLNRIGFPIPKLMLWQIFVGAVLALALGFWSIRRHVKSTKILAAVILAMLIQNMAVHPPRHASWNPNLDQALVQAEQNNTFVIADLYADWCAACKELELITFSNAEVQQELSAHILARVDLTRSSEQTDLLSERYTIIGLPTILFLNPDGIEIPGTRISGFLPPKAFIEHLIAARKAYERRQE